MNQRSNLLKLNQLIAAEDDAENMDAGLQGESSGSFKLEISEDMTVEEIMSYMADLKTPGNHQVSINLQHLINICTNHVQFSRRLIDLEVVNKNLVEQLDRFNQLKEENVFLRHRVTDLKFKLKSDAKDLKLLNSKVND